MATTAAGGRYSPKYRALGKHQVGGGEKHHLYMPNATLRCVWSKAGSRGLVREGSAQVSPKGCPQETTYLESLLLPGMGHSVHVPGLIIIFHVYSID